MPTVSDLSRRNQAWKEVAEHPPLSARMAGPAGAAQKKHLLLQRNASAIGLFHATFARLPIYLYTLGLRMCADSTCPFYLAVSGSMRAGWRGKKDLRRPPWQLLRSGSGGSCWRSQECSALSLSRVLCCRLCLTSAEKARQGEKWPDTHHFLAGTAGPAGAAHEKHLLLQRNASSRLDCITHTSFITIGKSAGFLLRG